MTNKGDNTHRCPNPNFTSNQSVSPSLVLTVAWLLMYRERERGGGVERVRNIRERERDVERDGERDGERYGQRDGQRERGRERDWTTLKSSPKISRSSRHFQSSALTNLSNAFY